MPAFPPKINYAAGDVLTAAQMNDVGDALAAYQFTVGKNKIINGDFNINARGFTSTTTDEAYGFDRWSLNKSGATATYSAETFTLGAAPVAGYEAKNFARLTVTTGNDFCRLQQKIESVRTFAGQTITVSFWAKGTNPTTAGNLKVYILQNFGTGGSPSSTVNVGEQTFVLTANWTRYALTFNIPSISGKTLGTNNNDFFAINFSQGASASTDAWTLDLWGVQAEAGSVATPFTTATGTLAGELAACQRYYYKLAAPNGVGSNMGVGFADSTTSAVLVIPFKVTMRRSPSALETSGTAGDYSIRQQGAVSTTLSGVPTFSSASTDVANVNAPVASGLTAGNGVTGRAVNSSAYLAWSAEL